MPRTGAEFLLMVNVSDFDNRVIDYFVKQYKKKTGTNVSTRLRAMGKLKREVEKAKCTLPSQQSTHIEIESFEDGNNFLASLACLLPRLSRISRGSMSHKFSLQYR